MNNEHYLLLEEMFLRLNKGNILKILDAGSGRTSLDCLISYFDKAMIDAVVYPGDNRKIVSASKVESYRISLKEIDICKGTINEKYDLVLAHLLLGEAIKWGNSVKNLLDKLLNIDSKYFIIFDFLEDDCINYNDLEKIFNDNFKTIYKSQIAKTNPQVFDTFIGKNYIAYLLEKVNKNT